MGGSRDYDSYDDKALSSGKPKPRGRDSPKSFLRDKSVKYDMNEGRDELRKMKDKGMGGIDHGDYNEMKTDLEEYK